MSNLFVSYNRRRRLWKNLVCMVFVKLYIQKLTSFFAPLPLPQDTPDIMHEYVYRYIIHMYSICMYIHILFFYSITMILGGCKISHITNLYFFSFQYYVYIRKKIQDTHKKVFFFSGRTTKVFPYTNGLVVVFFVL